MKDKTNKQTINLKYLIMQKTQTSDILQHLKDGRELTQKQAINEYGAYRLSSIIHSLRRQGHDIVSVPKKVKTRYKTKDGRNRTTTISSYVLNEKKKSFDFRLKNFIESIIN